MALRGTMVPTNDLPGFVLEGHWCPESPCMGQNRGHQGSVALAWALQHLVSLGPGPMSCLRLEEQEAAPSGLLARICLSPW